MITRLHERTYTALIRPYLFRKSAGEAHETVIRSLRMLESLPAPLLRIFAPRVDLPIYVGGVDLPSPFMLAAGLIKGDGFTDEDAALAAVQRGVNIIPGWRSLPALVGAVEFGSYTRFPRMGNAGVVMWRDLPTRSTQNRVGLKNPGACAAAAFLAKRRHQLPKIYGINLAVSPGVNDAEQERWEVIEGFRVFLDQGVHPSWFTLNLSCPNTEDDPGARQTADHARRLCAAAVEAADGVPLWVKVSPALAEEQYQALAEAFVETGVRAVIATNTIAQPTLDDPEVVAGVGGGNLHAQAVRAARILREALSRAQTVDVVACGGVIDGKTADDYARLGIQAFQYWSALVYRGIAAAALIERERHEHHA